MNEQRSESNSYIIQPSCFANEETGPGNLPLSCSDIGFSSLATNEVDVSRPQFIIFPLYVHVPSNVCFH